MGVLNVHANKLGSNIDWQLKEQLVGNANVQEYIEIARDQGLELVPFDIEGLINLLSIHLRSIPMENEKSGFFKKQDGAWVIGVNSLHHPYRRRFTMAHELGHFVFHRELGIDFEDTALFRDGESNTLEWDANKFASELLMPEREFRAFLKTNDSIDDVSDKFQVSTLAIKIRAKQLGFAVTI